MYVYRVIKISPVYEDEITGLNIIGRKTYPAYTYIHKGKLYCTLHLKHAVMNATNIAIQEGLAERVRLRAVA
jgi:hypothetical protein